MSTNTIVILALVALGVLAVGFVATAGARRDRSAAVSLSREARRKDRSNAALDDAAPTGREVERMAVLERTGAGSSIAVAAEPPPPAPYVAPDPETIAVTRRQFLNRGSVTLMGLGLSGFGATIIAFLWPQLSGGFGAKINAGKLADITGQIRDTKEPFYVAEARTWIAPYPEDALAKARKEYAGGVLTGMEAGIVALYQKCVHLGCRVPFCKSSQWFECPCHGSKYNRVGEKTGGPAPRGLDRFSVAITGGNVVVDTGVVIQGPALGVETTGQQPEGPFCA